MLTLELLAQLQSEAGQAAVAEAMRWVDDPLRGVEALRRTVGPELARAAMDQGRWRRRAAAKFSRADRMLFTQELLEQASGEDVSGWRAQRFAPYPTAADLCCGLGGDSVALARHTRVIAVDLDPVALALTRWNASVYGVPDRVQLVEGHVPHSVPNAPAAFIDPARRAEGQRKRGLEAMSPPLSEVLQLQASIPNLGVKLSPAVPNSELDAALARTPHEREFLSVRGECRELCAWFGALSREGAPVAATVLPAGLTLRGTGSEQVDIRPVGCYLYEPDAAVIRAHLANRLGEEIGAARIDAELAYLSADRLLPTPFATAYRIMDARPFSRKSLAAALRERGATDVVLKTRGAAIEPERLRRELRAALPRDAEPCCPVVFITRIAGRPTALMGERLGPGTDSPPAAAG